MTEVQSQKEHESHYSVKIQPKDLCVAIVKKLLVVWNEKVPKISLCDQLKKWPFGFLAL